MELTKEEIAALEKFRQAQAKKAADVGRANWKGFSFRFEMNDGGSVIWSGRAPDSETAYAQGVAKANAENDSGILDHCNRLYQSRGRKKVDPVESALGDPRDVTEPDDTQEEIAA